MYPGRSMVFLFVWIFKIHKFILWIFSHTFHTIDEIRTGNEKFRALNESDFKAAQIETFSVSRIFYSKM